MDNGVIGETGLSVTRLVELVNRLGSGLAPIRHQKRVAKTAKGQRRMYKIASWLNVVSFDKNLY